MFSNTLTFSTNRNQPDPPSDYDAGGNLQNIAGVSLQYDAENRLVQVGNGSVVFGYDANGVRVKKVSGAVTTIYVRSGGQVIAEYANGSLQRERIFAGASLVAMIDLTKQTTDPQRKRYYHADHLSTRVVTDANGAKVGEYGHYPFGETWYDTAADGQKFTTYERDAELSGQRIDYALARYYSYQMGRFISPDPVPGSTGNPQSLNRYAYALNDPVNLTDPTGLCPAQDYDNWCDHMGGGFGGWGGASWWGDASVGGGWSWSDWQEYQTQQFFGEHYSDLPGHYDPVAYEEWRHESIISTGYDPGLKIDRTTVKFVFEGVDKTDILEQQKELAAIKVGMEACAGQGPYAVASCIQDVYGSITTVPGPDRRPLLVGDNYNVDYSSIRIHNQPVIMEEFGCLGSRCGMFNTLDYSHSHGFHIDTANPLYFPVGTIVHLIADLIGGNTWWKGGVPR